MEINDAQLKLMKMASGHILARAIHTAAIINVADHLVKNSKSTDQLATELNLNADTLYRLLRFLASYGIFSEDENNNFSLTPLAQPLVSNDPNSIRAFLAYHDGDENRWRSYGHMEHSIRTGQPAFDHIFGKNYFDFISENPQLAQQFDEGMKNISADEEITIAQSYDFSPYQLIVDIGGGKGGLLTQILKNNLATSGIIFDLPHVKPSAIDYLTQQNISDKVEFVESTGFFEPIPQNADLYILKRILHDWNDEQCIQILQNCKEAMKSDSRLLIIDAVVQEGNTRDFAKEVDLMMMVLFGGKERTESEWRTLLEKAGLKLNHIYPTQTMLSIIEVTKQ